MRDDHPVHDPDDGSDEADGPGAELSSRHLEPLPAGPLVAVAVVGAVLGRLLRVVADAVDTAAPVSWLQVGALAFLAAALGGVAVHTRRQVRSTAVTLDPERMVNRLVLARAATVVGALLAGGYVGYGLSWLDAHPDLVVPRVGVALAAAVASLTVLVGGKWLEWACRVPKRDPHP
ncbi:DUF3180 domain-containing protein [Nocardioides sp. Y6]|uniref:DUF3180 domain-containing protein n=1 Tax=Nocardioides malaquae TaxID=2773426 RepID=A0ABR9RVX6_9ACTN|nr:DUF3180 domain-containing protein [Nocardioides malaquae]MBE7325505.1 DUF3180 domain-containing protein [Nocardioides malaquae]